MNKESAVKNISDMLINGKVAPWKAEQVSYISATHLDRAIIPNLIKVEATEGCDIFVQVGCPQVVMYHGHYP